MKSNPFAILCGFIAAGAALVIVGWTGMLLTLPTCALIAADALSPLGMLNFLVLQWFGVRLRRCEQSVTLARADLFLVGERIMASDSAGRRARWRVVAADGRSVRLRRYGLGLWIWPLTGWWTDYRYIARGS